MIIVGAGGHGLATAYYLAKEHGISDVAVLEKGWLGGGNTGRNTTIIRSNYLWDESARIYDHAVKLWEGLSQELNFNVMFSQRGVMHLAHTRARSPGGQAARPRQPAERRRQRVPDARSRSRRSSRCSTPRAAPAIRSWAPRSQRRGGTARHDAVAWGYARGADARGVDIIQNCEVTGIRGQGGKVEGVETTAAPIRCAKLAVVAAGHSSVIADMAGFRLPIESFPLQALVSEPVKPCVNTVIMSNAVHGYISQSDKGELVIGAGTDQFISYSQRGSFHIIEHTLQAIVELFPSFSRMRMLRQWGGIVDVTPDRSPIIGLTPVENLFINCGWGTGGFKATPGSGHVFAHTVATGEPHPIAAPVHARALLAAASWSTSTAPPRWRIEEEIHGQGPRATILPPTSTRRTFRCGRSARPRCCALGGSTSSTSTT